MGVWAGGGVEWCCERRIVRGGRNAVVSRQGMQRLGEMRGADCRDAVGGRNAGDGQARMQGLSRQGRCGCVGKGALGEWARVHWVSGHGCSG